ncbi:hypothetical protein PoB_005691900 [Plakobranchus ocellatus]|uniref:Uncharacterized protein n=1 Tax=Plakobranchus ocellatus TaxID=259542 RepID=A0AAV4CGV7_9GAST|nr:hypothetical protein PoB_005691900 [Plakobranchus ocellatus]
MFPWDDRGDGHPSDTTLLNTLAPVLVAYGLLTHVHNKVISGQGADDGADLLATVPPTPLIVGRSFSTQEIICSLLKGSNSQSDTP